MLSINHSWMFLFTWVLSLPLPWNPSQNPGPRVGGEGNGPLIHFTELSSQGQHSWSPEPQVVRCFIYVCQSTSNDQCCSRSLSTTCALGHIRADLSWGVCGFIGDTFPLSPLLWKGSIDSTSETPWEVFLARQLAWGDIVSRELYYKIWNKQEYTVTYTNQRAVSPCLSK